jgi:hypothetical protein
MYLNLEVYFIGAGSASSTPITSISISVNDYVFFETKNAKIFITNFNISYVNRFFYTNEFQNVSTHTFTNCIIFRGASGSQFGYFAAGGIITLTSFNFLSFFLFFVRL